MQFYTDASDRWQDTRKNYKLWHRSDFITALLMEATGSPTTGIGAGGDFSLTQNYYQKNVTNFQMQQSVQGTSSIGGGSGGGPSQTPAQVKVTNSVDQTIPNNTHTKVNFDTTLFDSSSQHDNVTNNTRLTCVQSGLYLIVGQIGFAPNNTGTRQVDVLLNNGASAVISEYVAPNPTVTSSTVLNFSMPMHLSPGDYIEVSVFQLSGGALNIFAAFNFFSMIRLGNANG